MNPSSSMHQRNLPIQTKPLNNYIKPNIPINPLVGNQGYSGMGFNLPIQGNNQYGNFSNNMGVPSVNHNVNSSIPNNMMYNSGAYPYNYSQMQGNNNMYGHHGQPQQGMPSMNSTNNSVYRSSSQNMHSNNYSTKKKVQQLQNPNYMNKPYNNYAPNFESNDSLKLNPNSNLGGGYNPNGVNNNMYNNYSTSTLPFNGYYGLPKNNSTYKKN